MKPGRKPVPTALKRLQGNPGKRAYNHDEPEPPEGVLSCPDHLNAAAREEWDRLVLVLHEMGVVTLIDRTALAAYCQCYGRWVEAEEKLRATPILLKTATGNLQQSPWLSISNKQPELMGRYMTELGLTPVSRSRVAAFTEVGKSPDIVFITRYADRDDERINIPMPSQKPALGGERSNARPAIIHLDEDDLNL